MQDNIQIRLLRGTAEMEAAVELQKIYWGEDMGNLVPGHMLLSIANHGGHVHGAFDGDKLVGIVIGFLGAEYDGDSDVPAGTHLLVMSKRMVVLPEYRSKKIGEELKRAQREFALRHAIQLVTWTFDPLLARNAYLNLHKLRGIGQHYVEDYFGGGATNSVLSADRLVVNWWVNHPHLQAVTLPHPEDLPVANQVSLNQDALLLPHDFSLPDAAVIRLEIPAEFQPLERLDAALAADWRSHIRLAFQQIMRAGYLATDFVRVENRTFYVFTRDDGTFSFQ